MRGGAWSMLAFSTQGSAGPKDGRSITQVTFASQPRASNFGSVSRLASSLQLI